MEKFFSIEDNPRKTGRYANLKPIDVDGVLWVPVFITRRYRTKLQG